MKTKQLTSIARFCQMGKVEFSFIEALQEHGLLELIILDNVSYISNEQLKAVERAIAFHYVLNINVEGIAAISDLLLQIETLQLELQRAKNKLNPLCGLKCEGMLDVVDWFSIGKIHPLQHCHS